MAERELELSIPAGRERLAGTLVVPAEPAGLVLFAHGGGSNRFSPRNRAVARALQGAGFGTLLLDLRTRADERLDGVAGSLRFDIPLLADRLLNATDWIVSQRAAPARLGYFGASRGAAVALMAAARSATQVGAVVSRGGRPDLAGPALADIRAPTLLIVGGDDVGVLELNHAARDKLATADKQLRVVSGATHLFEEPGALDEVARLAAGWFRQTLAGRPAQLAVDPAV